MTAIFVRTQCGSHACAQALGNLLPDNEGQHGFSMKLKSVGRGKTGETLAAFELLFEGEPEIGRPGHPVRIAGQVAGGRI